MDSIELTQLQRRLRVSYELGRVRLSLLGMLPVVLVVACAACATQRPESALCFGVCTLAAGAAMLWYGREPQRAVLPGVLAGLIPLVLALVANRMHLCGPSGCSTWCVPACVAGGVVAGIAIAIVGHRRRAGAFFWLSASTLALFTGAMGCACVGFSGVAGLLAGFAAGVVPGAIRRALR